MRLAVGFGVRGSAGVLLLLLRVVLAAVVDGVKLFRTFDLVLVLVVLGRDILAKRLRPAKLALLLGVDLVLDLRASQNRPR